MTNFNCPICNQAGLSNYRQEHIICPQCNSDLKSYLLLQTLSQKKNYKRKNVAIQLVLAFFCFFLTVFLFRNFNEYKLNLEKDHKTIQLLQDSIFNYKNNTKTLYVSNTKNKTDGKTVAYTIKKGDNPWKVAKFFYGDGRLYKQIEIENNLKKPYPFKVGQLLNIKIPN